jgi:hypothetical protein
LDAPLQNPDPPCQTAVVCPGSETLKNNGTERSGAILQIRANIDFIPAQNLFGGKDMADFRMANSS